MIYIYINYRCNHIINKLKSKNESTPITVRLTTTIPSQRKLGGNILIYQINYYIDKSTYIPIKLYFCLQVIKLTFACIG